MSSAEWKGYLKGPYENISHRLGVGKSKEKNHLNAGIFDNFDVSKSKPRISG
jgi:hypothetical protein